jgi:hypothetical protein
MKTLLGGFSLERGREDEVEAVRREYGSLII